MANHSFALICLILIEMQLSVLGSLHANKVYNAPSDGKYHLVCERNCHGVQSRESARCFRKLLSSYNAPSMTIALPAVISHSVIGSEGQKAKIENKISRDGSYCERGCHGVQSVECFVALLSSYDLPAALDLTLAADISESRGVQQHSYNKFKALETTDGNLIERDVLSEDGDEALQSGYGPLAESDSTALAADDGRSQVQHSNKKPEDFEMTGCDEGENLTPDCHGPESAECLMAMLSSNDLNAASDSTLTADTSKVQTNPEGKPEALEAAAQLDNINYLKPDCQGGQSDDSFEALLSRNDIHVTADSTSAADSDSQTIQENLDIKPKAYEAADWNVRNHHREQDCHEAQSEDCFEVLMPNNGLPSLDLNIYAASEENQYVQEYPDIATGGFTCPDDGNNNGHHVLGNNSVNLFDKIFSTSPVKMETNAFNPNVHMAADKSEGQVILEQQSGSKITEALPVEQPAEPSEQTGCTSPELTAAETKRPSLLSTLTARCENVEQCDKPTGTNASFHTWIEDRTALMGRRTLCPHLYNNAFQRRKKARRQRLANLALNITLPIREVDWAKKVHRSVSSISQFFERVGCPLPNSPEKAQNLVERVLISTTTLIFFPMLLRLLHMD